MARQPQPYIVEALDDTGLEGIQKNFEVLFKENILGTRFSELETVLGTIATIGTRSYLLISATGTLITQAISIPVAEGGTGVATFGGVNTLLYTTTANVLSSITTANTSALVTGSTGIPGWTSGSTNNRVLRTNGTTITFSQVVLTTDVSGTLPVGNGGTGQTTFAVNGVLYGNTASGLLVTAQGAANSILTANAGAPSFSAAPVIGTSVTTPILIGGSAIGSSAEIRSTSAAGTTDFTKFTVGNNGNLEAMRINHTGNVGIGVVPGTTYLLEVVGSARVNGLEDKMGTSANFMTNVGVANVQTSAAGVGNAADTTDDTLFTYSLPLNSMSANGKSLRAVASGHFATNGNTKEVKFWFAGATLVDSGILTLSNTDWQCTIEVTRVDATHVSTIGVLTANTLGTVTTVNPNLVVANLTSNASVVKVTGASTIIGAANDVLGYQMKTWFEN